MISPHDVHPALIFERQSERQSDATHRGELPVKRAETFYIAGHMVEQDCRRRAAALFREHVSDSAHLHIPVSAVDPTQLSHLVDLFEPVT